MNSKITVTAAFVLSTTLLIGQVALPPALHRHVTTVSSADKNGSEPSIAVNPNNPNQVVAAFQPATIAYSTDGGQTFATADLPPVEGWRTGGDVSVRSTIRVALIWDRFTSTNWGAHRTGRTEREGTEYSYAAPWMAEKLGRKMHQP